MKPAALNKKHYEEIDIDKEILLSDTSANLFIKNRSSKKSRRNSNSKNTTKESYNLSVISGNSSSVLAGDLNKYYNNNLNLSQNNIISSIKSLQDKISLYENEIKNLVEEKIQMQIIISSLSNANCDCNCNSNINSNGSEYKLRDDFSKIKNQIDKHKDMLKQDDSILDHTITKSKNEPVKKHVKVRENSDAFLDYNKNLFGETSQLDLSDDCREGKKLFDQQKSQISDNILEKSIKCQNKSSNSLSLSILSNENLPNIEQFFVYKNKFSLVDSDKNLWHLKKCKKFQNFTKTNQGKFQSKEENLMAFLEYYQNLNQDKSKIEINITEPDDISIIKKENDQTVVANPAILDNSLDLSSSKSN